MSSSMTSGPTFLPGHPGELSVPRLYLNETISPHGAKCALGFDTSFSYSLSSPEPCFPDPFGAKGGLDDCELTTQGNDLVRWGVGARVQHHRCIQLRQAAS